MNRRLSVLLLAAVLSVTAAAAATAQGKDGKYRAPRSPSGHPDLQGTWNFNSGVPLQRPAAFADRKTFTKEEFNRQHAAIRNGLQAIAKVAPVEAVGLDWFDNEVLVNDLRTSLITYPASGRLPAVVEGVRRIPRPDDFIALLGDSKGPPPGLAALAAMFMGGGPKDSYTSFSMSERCLFDVEVPLLPQLEDNYVQIVQGSDSVALVSDFGRRVIAVDGRPAVAGSLRSWTGVSRGHWEGETLVVEIRNFNGRQPSFAGVGTSRDKVVTERFTRTSSNGLEYAATIVDPSSFKDRIELSFPMALVDARIHEGACHEGNYSLPYMLSAARLEDGKRVAKE